MWLGLCPTRAAETDINGQGHSGRVAAWWSRAPSQTKPLLAWHFKWLCGVCQHTCAAGAVPINYNRSPLVPLSSILMAGIATPTGLPYMYASRPEGTADGDLNWRLKQLPKEATLTELAWRKGSQDFFSFSIFSWFPATIQLNCFSNAFFNC